MKDAANTSSEIGETWDYLHRALGNEATVGGDKPQDDAAFWSGGKETVDLIEQLAQGFPGKDVLDYGCGKGRLACWTMQRCKSLVCVDASPYALENLRSNLAQHGPRPIPVQLFRAERLAAVPTRSTYDVIYAWYVVFHLTPIQALGFIRDAFHRLRSGGTLVFNHANIFHPASIGVLRTAAQQGEWVAGDFPYSPMSSRVLVHFATEVMGFAQATVNDSTALRPVIVCTKA